jgi:hypothetical protein
MEQDGDKAKLTANKFVRFSTRANLLCQGKNTELRDYIEKGSDKAGTLRNLAEVLNQPPEALTAAKGGRRGLPTYACVKLAQLIGEDERRVIAASELVTEKNPERRAVWLPFVQAIAETAKKQTARTAKRASDAMIFRVSGFECVFCPMTGVRRAS